MQVRASQIRNMIVSALRDPERLEMLPPHVRETFLKFDIEHIDTTMIGALVDYISVCLAQDLIRLDVQRNAH